MYQDSFGYLWVGTANGLNRFDGRNFINFRVKKGLPAPAIDRVYEDHRHRLWVGTRGGIAELKGDSFYVYPVSDGQKIKFVSEFLEPDSTTLWATTDRGLYEFQNQRWIKITLLPGYENTSISKIIKTKNFLYINYENRKLVRLGKNDDTVFLLSVNSNRAFYNSTYVIHDTPYIGTYSGLFYRKADKWVPVFQDTLQHKFLFFSYPDDKNHWWFGTEEDGVLMVAGDKNHPVYQHFPQPFNLVSNIYEDRDENIWVAGFQGLMKISPAHYRSVPIPMSSTLGTIRNFAFLPSGKIILSGDNGIVMLLPNPGNGPVKPSGVIMKRLGGDGDFFDFFTSDDKSRFWFTTRKGNLYLLDSDQLINKTGIIKPKNKELNDIGYNPVTREIYVCADSVLLNGNEYSLDTFFSNKKKFVPDPRRIYIDKRTGTMLVQTLESGLLEITPDRRIRDVGETTTINQFTYDERPGNPGLWAVRPDLNISRYSLTPELSLKIDETIRESEGLPEDYITGMTTDRQNRLWLATNGGITMIGKDQQERWIHLDFDISDGNSSIPFSFAKVRTDNNGNIWASARHKLILIDHEDNISFDPPLSTVIENVLLFGSPTDWSLIADSLSGYQMMPVNPVLKYDQNTLSIKFSALQFTGNSPAEYSYKLQPDDTAWSNPTAGNIVSFYQLNPGKYTFEVRAHQKGFQWGKPAVFAFTIITPYWERWWFRILVIFTAVVIIVLIFRYRLKQLRERTEMKDQLRELEMKAFKLQMSPHFVHNALNSIQSLVVNNKNNEAARYINKFAKLLRQVLENSEKNLITLDKELYSLELYVELEKMRMNMNVDYHVTLQPDLINSEIKIPPLILQPFVENALWHGLSTKEGQKSIQVNIHYGDGWLTCEITDNGIGRQKAAEQYERFPEGHLSKAVNIIQQRLADFNQSPDILPVTFIDLEEDGKATGTSVIVQIRINSID